MNDVIGRPQAAAVYVWLTGLATFEVVVQGFLFSGFYSKANRDWLDVHGIAGELTGYVVVLLLIPLGFLAKFPQRFRIGWLTVLLAVAWNVQAHVFGYGIEDTRWFEMVHIPLAFGVLLLALYLTVRAAFALRSAKGA